MKALFAIALAFASHAVRADTTSYNGDFRGGDSFVTQADTLSDMMVFSQINVLGPHVTTLWGNFLIYQQYASASMGLRYEFRTGISSGNGGTLLSSGLVTDLHQTPTGRSTHNSAYREVQLLGTVSIDLAPGVYWLGLQNNEGTKPPAQWTSFLAQTLGDHVGDEIDPNPTPQNAILDHNSYAAGTELGDYVQQNADYSIGLVAVPNVISAVPEPASGVLLALRTAALFAFARRWREIIPL